MTLTICLIICALTVAGYIWGKFPMEVIALCSMALFIITGCVDGNTALANFGNTNGIMLMSMFVVAAGFRRTQFVNVVAKEGLIKSARADCGKILRQNAAQFRRNTLCISRNCNKIMPQNFRKPPKTHLISASLTASISWQRAA